MLVTGARQSGKSTVLEYVTNMLDEKVNIVSLDDMRERMLAQSDIAKDIGVDVETINKWTGVLSNIYIIFLLQPNMNNNVGRIIKRPKIYFMDTGLACYLTGYVSAKTLQKSAYSGQIFETYVVTEIIKSYTNNQRDPKKHLSFFFKFKSIVEK